jgi:hypothetical protein
MRLINGFNKPGGLCKLILLNGFPVASTGRGRAIGGDANARLTLKNRPAGELSRAFNEGPT